MNIATQPLAFGSDVMNIASTAATYGADVADGHLGRSPSTWLSIGLTSVGLLAKHGDPTVGFATSSAQFANNFGYLDGALVWVSDCEPSK